MAEPWMNLIHLIIAHYLFAAASTSSSDAPYDAEREWAMDSSRAVPFEGLARATKGELVTPGHGAYESLRVIWNGMVDRRPAGILRCKNEQDVAHAIAFTQAHSLPLAVRGGGHSISGACLCDGGLVIDFSAMRDVAVDVAGRTATAMAGAWLGDLDRATQVHGLATTMGVNSDTGIAGLTLGGGVGRLAHKHGLACDNLLSARVVLADGRVVTASAQEHPDLFWALRGGGGKFGVVTEFKYRLHPRDPTVIGGMLIYDWANARAAMRQYAACLQTASEDLDLLGVLLTLPDGEPAFVVVVFHGGTAAAAAGELRPLRGARPRQDTVGPMSYLDLQASGDGLFLRGRRYYWKTHFLRRLDHGLIDLVLDRFARVPSPHSLIAFQPLGGATGRVAPDATAFVNRDARIDFIPASIWEEQAVDATNVDWVRSIWDAAAGFGTGGVYVNNLGDEGDQRVQAAYGANMARLATVKARYDPDNLFRLNQNIRPHG